MGAHQAARRPRRAASILRRYQSRMARWTSRAVPDPLIVTDFAAVAPAYADGALGETGNEVEDLHTHYGARVLDDTYSAVKESLSSPDLRLWHFAGHGSYPSRDPNSSVIRLSDGSFYPSDIETFRQDKRPGPFVFLNACQAGGQGFTFTGIGGWADTFCNLGGDGLRGTVLGSGRRRRTRRRRSLLRGPEVGRDCRGRDARRASRVRGRRTTSTSSDLACVLTALPAECPGDAAHGGTSDMTKWSIAVYMGGNNNLSMAADTDIDEILSRGSTDDVKVAVFARRQLAPGVSGPAKRFLVGAAGQAPQMDDLWRRRFRRPAQRPRLRRVGVRRAAGRSVCARAVESPARASRSRIWTSSTRLRNAVPSGLHGQS